MAIIAFVDHWQGVLHDYIQRRQNEPFAWGKMDCCLFACDAVLELTGVDLAADFRGKYDSSLSAVRAMRSFIASGKAEQDLVEAVAVKIAARYSIQEVPVLCAQRGDIVLLDSPMGKGLGIVGLLGYKVHSTGHDGIVDSPLRECLRAWRIPKSCVDHPLNRK